MKTGLEKYFLLVRGFFRAKEQEIERSWWSIVPRSILFLVSLAVFLALSNSPAREMLFLNHPLSIGTFLVVASTALLLVKPILEMTNSYYEFTNDGLFIIDGILGVKAKGRAILYSDIRGVELRQSLLDRFFGIGDIIIYSRSSGLSDVCLEKLVTPQAYLKKLEQRVKKYNEELFG